MQDLQVLQPPATPELAPEEIASLSDEVRELAAQRRNRAACLDLLGSESRDARKRTALPFGKRAGNAVRDTQGAENAAVVTPYRRRGEKAQSCRGSDERMPGELRIGRRVAHDDEAVLGDCARAERVLARQLRHRDAAHGLEPLALGIQQPEQRDRRVAGFSRERDELVERTLGRCVEKPGASDRIEPSLFVCGIRRFHHASRPRTGRSHGALIPLAASSRPVDDRRWSSPAVGSPTGIDHGTVQASHVP